MKIYSKNKLWIAAVALLFAACNSDYLDRIPEAEGLDFETVFMDSTNYRDFVNYLIVNPHFLHLQNGVRPLGNWDDISDNSISTAIFAGVPSVQAAMGDFYRMRGNADAVQASNETWDQIWKNIRIANTGIQNIEYYPGGEVSKNRILGMCYFYRGFYYMELTRRWGGMPYLYHPIAEATANMDFPRLSMQETYLLAASDCDSAIMYLDRDYVTPNEFQLPTRIGALAIKSRILLYAASDQARYENHPTNPGLNLWERAAIVADSALVATEDVRDDTGEPVYGLVEWGAALNGDDGYYNLFKDTQYTMYMREILHGRRAQINWGSDAYINTIRPPGQLSGKYGVAVNQLLVDCFEMQETGLPPSDLSSGYNPQNPYVGRDPRFYHNVLYNESVCFNNRKMEIWQEEEGRGLTGSQDCSISGQGVVMGFTQTGYYMRKWMGKIWDQNLPQQYSYIRLAEVYLNFAEAANEAWGAPETKHGSCRYSALEALTVVRERANMFVFDPKFLNQSDFRARVRNERRVELCFEEHRLFDIRRWKIGSQPENRDIWRMRITKLAAGYDPVVYPTGFRYQPELFSTRIFEEKHNLFVIKQNDAFVGPNFSQNPGW